MRTALVTGVTGFVGSWVARALLDAGWRVLGVKRSTSSLHALGDAVIPLFDADTSAGRSLIEVAIGVDGVDAIVHCAADMGRAAGPEGRLQDAVIGSGTDLRAVRANVVFPMTLLEGAIARKVSVFLNTDTCVPEHYPAMRPYALSKAQFVAWGKSAAAGTATRFVNLRLCQPYGPRLRPGMFVHWFLRRCLEGGTILLTPGGQIRDFTYASDVAAAYLAVLDKAASLPAGFSHFDCGIGVGTTVQKFAELAHRLTGSAATLQFGALPYREREFDWVARNQPLLNLGWTPEIGLEEGIRRMLREEFRVEPQA